MSANFKKIWNGLNLGSQASDPASPNEGDHYTNSVSNRIRVYINGAWRDQVEADLTQTLSNKSLVDASTAIVDSGDPTKQIKFDAGGTTGTSTTLTAAQTANRVITIPDATTTMVGTDVAQSLSNKEISDNLTFVEQSSTPSTPAATKRRLYPKTTGKFYHLGSDGIERQLDSSSSATGDDLDSLTFKASFRDDFSETAGNTNCAVDTGAGKTDAATYSSNFLYYRLAYDASKTVTGTGTSMTLSGAPGFTIKAGDMLIVGTEARRITAAGTQTTPTIESAFSTDPSGAACNVSQAVHTKDLNAFAADGLPVNNVHTGNISEILALYEDTTTSGDIIFDNGVAPVIAYTASSDGTTFTSVNTRPTNISSTLAVVGLSTSSTSLYLRLFANKTSGTGLVNVLGYKVYFHRETAAEDGGIRGQAYCFTDGTGTEIGCSAPTVVSGKTRINLTAFTYATGINPSNTNGQLDVYLNGQKLPRFIDSTLTPDQSYKEIDNKTIELDDDYSSNTVAVEIVKRINLIDSSDANGAKLRGIYDAIAGSAQEVTDGAATHSTVQAAHDAVSTGGRILILNGTFTENLSVSKQVTIEGKGRSSVINGTVTFTSAADYSMLRSCKVANDITLNSGADAIYVKEIWLASGKTFIDNGSANVLEAIQE